jgi:hypothetical protein
MIACFDLPRSQSYVVDANGTITPASTAVNWPESIGEWWGNAVLAAAQESNNPANLNEYQGNNPESPLICRSPTLSSEMNCSERTIWPSPISPIIPGAL